MKIATQIMLLTAILYLTGCNEPVKKNDGESKIVKDAVQAAMPVRKPTLADCVRGLPQPIVKYNNDYTTEYFQLSADSLSATEAVCIDNGDSLFISNTGCNNYVIHFRFETSRYKADTTDLKYWFLIAGRLLVQLMAAYNHHEPLSIYRSLVFLESYVGRDAGHQFRDLHLGDHINYGENGVHAYITIDRIEKIRSDRYAVELTYVHQLKDK